MRMNDTMLGYLQTNEAIRRQAENPYQYLTQMADIAKLGKIYNQQKDIVKEVKNTDSVSIRSSREKIKSSLHEDEKNNGLEGVAFYSSSGVQIKNVARSTFEYFV